MIRALLTAFLTVGKRLRLWIIAALALIGVMWFTNQRSERRGREAAERTADERASADIIERLQTRQEIDRQARNGGARQRLRDRLKRRKHKGG